LNYLASLRHRIDSAGVEKAITFVGLDPKDKKHVGKYSLGMKQRLGIAQAIMENPSILILDEPMNGLDKSGVESIRQLLQNLKSEGRTIILASHLQDDIDLLCDTVHLVENSTLVSVR
jgi:ABC-2 type transport system ATP-binding protein